MSLRDLATTSLCAPSDAGSSSVGAASSSGNPLAKLVEAVLPSSTQPPPRAGAASSAVVNSELYPPTSAKSKSSRPSYSDAHLIHSSFDAQLHPSALEHPANSARAPHAFSHSQLHPIVPLPPLAPVSTPLPMAPPPVPPPEVGAPTDLFERAFDSASKKMSAPVGPALPHPHPASTYPHRPRHVPASPNPLMYQPLYSPTVRSSWRLNSAMSALSLLPANASPAPFVTSTPPHSTSLYTEPLNKPGSAATQPTSVPGTNSNVHRTEDILVTEAAPAETPKNGHILPTSSSWGEDFTSLEGLSLGMEQQQHLQEQPASEIDDFLLNDTLQTAFQQWLRRDHADNYQFAERQYSSPRQRALKALKEGIRSHADGRLSSAVFHLEDALNRSDDGDTLPLEKRALAWYVLGLSLADLDDDERSIQALSQGLKSYDGVEVGQRREDNPYVWQSLIALSVSFTNELEYSKALRCIREWLELRNASSTGDAEAGIGTAFPDADLFRQSDHDDLLQKLNNLASKSPTDVDAFIVLGILHNLNRDYEPAAVALRHAVTLRPNMPNLWNKLGATLANGGNSDDALRSYRKAVDLQPKLVRAWVNVGTAYANREEFSKAMRYYLKAISMSEYETLEIGNAASSAVTGKSDSSLHVWGYVRNALLSMSRADLLYLVENQDVKGLKAHFGF